MKTVKKFSITTAVLAILMVCSLSGWAQSGKIHGTLKNGEEVMPGESVQLWKDNSFTGKGAVTNEDGKFEFALLDPGNYSIKVVNKGRTIAQTVSLEADENEPVVMQIATGDENGPVIGLGPIEIRDSKEIYTVDPKITFTMNRKEIKEFGGGRGIGPVAALAPGMVQKDAGDPLNFKGGRSDANATYIDGMKMRGTDELPLGSIEQVTVVTGGLPAEYGDVMGAVIVVTTRNPGMTMGHVGKPLTKAEKQLNKQMRKRGNQEGGITPTIDDLACN